MKPRTLKLSPESVCSWVFEFFNDGQFFMAEKVISLITVSVAPVSISIIIYFPFMNILVWYNLGLPTFLSTRNMYISGRSISGTIMTIHVCVCVCVFVGGWGADLISGIFELGPECPEDLSLAWRPQKELCLQKPVRPEEKDEESVRGETQKQPVQSRGSDILVSQEWDSKVVSWEWRFEGESWYNDQMSQWWPHINA